MLFVAHLRNVTPMKMPDGNTAALSAHEIEQDRREKLLPASSVARKRVELLDEALSQVTFHVVLEALTEAPGAPLEIMAGAVRANDHAGIGAGVMGIVERYVDTAVVADRMEIWEQEMLFGRREDL